MVKIDEAIMLLENDDPNDYLGTYVQIRDSIFLNKAKELQERKKVNIGWATKLGI